jgi:hypothetical protein
VKKMIAAVTLSTGLVMGSAVGASATNYGPVPPAAKHVVKDVNAALGKAGKVGCKKSAELKKRVRLADKYDTLTPKAAKNLLKKINAETKKSCR